MRPDVQKRRKTCYSARFGSIRRYTAPIRFEVPPVSRKMDSPIQPNSEGTGRSADAEPEANPRRTQPQAQLSCTACRRRKVRCDRQQPCTACNRIGHNCVYPEKRRPIRTVRKPTTSNVADRITHLEKTVRAIAKSKSVSKHSSSWAQSCDPEILVQEGLSSQYCNDVLLSRIIDPIIHVPTDQIDLFSAINNPSEASNHTLALCFAIYYASSIVLEDDDSEALFEGNKILGLYQFKLGLEQALARAQFFEYPTVRLLQALAIYLVVLPLHHGGRSNWLLNGLALRSAQSIGLHRDGTKLGLGPFDSEVRRRLWWHLLGKDGRTAEDHGLNAAGNDIASSISLPLNIDDTDLCPEMDRLPPARLTWTPMTFSLIRIEFSLAWNTLMKAAASAEPPQEETRTTIINNMKSRLSEHLRYCNSVVPLQRLALHISTFVTKKLEFVARQQWFILHHPEVREPRVTDDDLTDALEVLELGTALAVDEDLFPYQWVAWAYPQYHVLLYVLSYLCTRPEGPMVDKAWATVEAQFNHAKIPESTLNWKLLSALRSKAEALRQPQAMPSQLSEQLEPIVLEDLTEDSSKKQVHPADCISPSAGSEPDFTESFDSLDWTSMFALEGSQFDGMDLSTFGTMF
ncbi:hypothetical protein ACJZ2D_014390 [Fusarium nematophilum]